MFINSFPIDICKAIQPQFNTIFSQKSIPSYENSKLECPIEAKRDEYLNMIKSQKRKLYFQNKRLEAFSFSVSALLEQIENLKIHENGLEDDDDLLYQHLQAWKISDYDAPGSDKLITSINSSDRASQHLGTVGIRKLLSTDNPPIQHVIDCGVIPKLVEFMQRNDEPYLQAEAVWSLANISSGTTQQTKQVIDQGPLPMLIQLLSSPKLDIVENSLFAIGNIAGDSPLYRDLVLTYEALPFLVNLINKGIEGTTRQVYNLAVWVLTNLCRGKPAPSYESVKDALPVLAAIIQEETNNQEALTDALWGLVYFSEIGQFEDALWQSNIFPMLIKYLDHVAPNVVAPSTKILANYIASGDPEQFDSSFDVTNIIQKICQNLFSKITITKDIHENIHKIVTAHPDYLQMLMKTPENLLNIAQPAFIGLSNIAQPAVDGPNYDIKTGTVIIFKQAIASANEEQIKLLAEKGIFDCLGIFIQNPDPVMILAGLIGIEKFLAMGALIGLKEGTENKFLEQIEQKGWVKIIESLQTHENIEIYQVASSILERFHTLQELDLFD